MNRIFAFPYEVIEYENNEILLNKVNKIIENENIERIIIGDPVNIQGERSSLSKKIYDIIDFLKCKLNIDIHMQDERYTSKIAEEKLRDMKLNPKDKKKVIDKVAAAVILENYLIHQ